MATIIDGVTPCADPIELFKVCKSVGLSVDWWGKANIFRVPLGRGPGTGAVLLRDFDLSSIDQTIDHTLTLLDDQGSQRTLQKITFLYSRCLTPGAPDNDGSHFLCDLVDRRYFLARIPCDVAFNVAAADGLSYLSGTLNGGVAWTWQGIVDNLCSTLGLGSLALPFTPTAAPENLIFWGGRAWEALNQVLDRCACTIKYDAEQDTFTIIRRGDASAAGAITAANLLGSLTGQGLKTWDSYWNEPDRPRIPESIRVIFQRRPQPIDGTSYVYTVTVPLGDSDSVAGTVEDLHDNLTAVGAGAPTNAATLATVAAERAADWLRNKLYNESRFTVTYRDFQQGMPLLAETTGRVTYDDREMMGTSVESGPDGAIERFRGYEQPLVLMPSLDDSGMVLVQYQYSSNFSIDPFTVSTTLEAEFDGSSATVIAGTAGASKATASTEFLLIYSGTLTNGTGSPIVTEFGFVSWTGASPPTGGTILGGIFATIPAGSSIPIHLNLAIAIVGAIRFAVAYRGSLILLPTQLSIIG